MGYYYTYILEWKENSPTVWEVAEFVHGLEPEKWDDAEQVERLIRGETNVTGWDERQETITAVSRHWPHNAFQIQENGETDVPREAEYYLNGESYRVAVTAPEFNPTMLMPGHQGEDLPVVSNYRFVLIPPEAGDEPWEREYLWDNGKSPSGKPDQYQVTFIYGSTPPDEYINKGQTCTATRQSKDEVHGDAAAYTWEFSIPELASQNGFAGYCQPCLLNIYGVKLPQVREIFGLG